MSYPLGPEQHATFSPDRRFRFSLVRNWTFPPVPRLVHFCLLNPSIADEQILDPTLRRCVGFAQMWGASGMVITNLFPLVSTDPAELLRAEDRSGPSPAIGRYENDQYIESAMDASFLTVLGWGTNVDKKPRHSAIPIGCVIPRLYHQVLKPRGLVYCIRKSKMGHPVHPLYLPYVVQEKLVEWTP
jgi:hypothetical protein